MNGSTNAAACLDPFLLFMIFKRALSSCFLLYPFVMLLNILFSNLAFFFPVMMFSFSSFRGWGFSFLLLPSRLLSSPQALCPCFFKSRSLHAALKAFDLPFLVRYLTLAVSLLYCVLSLTISSLSLTVLLALSSTIFLALLL